MKIINRLAERWEMPSMSVIAQTQDGSDDYIHVVVCPYSGDVEVWDGERLEFKAYCDKTNCLSTAVGLSGFFRQSKRGKSWKRLVERCKRLNHDRAFHEVYRFALDVATAVEPNQSGETCACAPRTIALKPLLNEACRERERRIAAGVHKPCLFSKRASGDALRPGQVPPWGYKIDLIASGVIWS